MALCAVGGRAPERDPPAAMRAAAMPMRAAAIRSTNARGRSPHQVRSQRRRRGGEPSGSIRRGRAASPRRGRGRCGDRGRRGDGGHLTTHVWASPDIAPDPAAGVSRFIAPARRSPSPEPGPMPSRAQLLAAGLLDAARGPAALARLLIRGGLFYPRQLLGELARLGGSLGEIGWELLNPAPRVPLNGPIGEHRRYELRRVGLEEVRAIKLRYEATVNDVVLA